jgi:Asp/Glu/hydantoin racemase
LSGTTLIALTAPASLLCIATRAAAQIGGATLLETLAKHHSPADNAIVAAFADPGPFGARELFGLPVITSALTDCFRSNPLFLRSIPPDPVC